MYAQATRTCFVQRSDKERIKDNAERGSLIDISLSSLRPMPAFWDMGTAGDGDAKGRTGAQVLKRTASLPGGSVHRFKSKSHQIHTAEPALEGEMPPPMKAPNDNNWTECS